MTEKNLEKPTNCYDCMISNDCELFWQNSFSVRPLVLDKYRIRGCEYEKLLQKLQGEAST